MGSTSNLCDQQETRLCGWKIPGDVNIGTTDCFKYWRWTGFPIWNDISRLLRGYLLPQRCVDSDADFWLYDWCAKQCLPKKWSLCWRAVLRSLVSGLFVRKDVCVTLLVDVCSEMFWSYIFQRLSWQFLRIPSHRWALWLAYSLS